MHCQLLKQQLPAQVWYPNSAQKTAFAMEEFDRESLPLVILANWRGFSGGQRDLFDGILQVGKTTLASSHCGLGLLNLRSDHLCGVKWQ